MKPADKTPSRPKKWSRASALFLLPIIALIVAVVALAAVGIVGYQQWQQTKHASQQHAALLVHLEQQRQNHYPTQKQWQRLAQQQTHFAVQLAALSKQHTPADASQLTRAQTQNLITAYHMLVSFAALQAQQQLLLNQPKPHIALPIQHLLADHISLPIALALKPQLHHIVQQIQALPTLNILQTQKQLDRLSQTLITLHFAAPIPKAKTTPTPAQKPHGTSWHNALQDAWHTLHGYLIIRSDHAINQALLFRSGRLNALALIQQNLAAAHFAIWRQDQVSYNTALSHAISAVEHFCQNTTETQAWVQQVKALQQQAVAYPIKQQKSLLRQLTLLGAHA